MTHPRTILLVSMGVAVAVGACIIPDRDIQVVIKNPCGEEWAAQTVGAYGYNGDGSPRAIKSESGEWISQHYCFNHADGAQAADINSPLVADMLSNVVLACEARAAELGLSDTDQTCTTTADIAYIGKCQYAKGGCEDPPAETGGETGGSDETAGGFAEFGELDLQAEISFERGEFLISEQLIDTALADPMGMVLDGTSLELIVDAAGDVHGFRVGGVERDNLGGLLGLLDGDLLIEIGGQPTMSFEQLLDATAYALQQDYVGVLIVRDDSVISLRYRRR